MFLPVLLSLVTRLVRFAKWENDREKIRIYKPPLVHKGSFGHDTSLLGAATITRLVGHSRALLIGIITNLDQPYLGLATVDGYRATVTVVEGNDTVAGYSQDC